jgi:hypothetical protein
MPNNDFESPSKESEALAQKLSESKDSKTRRKLLGQLRLVINQLDRPMIEERPDRPSK